MDELLYPKLSFEVMGAAIEVHRELGPGLLERAYHQCLCHELGLRGLDYESKVRVRLNYRGMDLGVAYEADIVVENRIVLELEACLRLLSIHSAQLYTYMRLLDMRLGYLFNFHVEKLMTKGRGYIRQVR